MKTVYTSKQYRLRAGAPMPIQRGFVIHTFKAEVSDIDIITYTDEQLVGSDQFRGQKIGSNLISASYSRLPHVGGDAFQGKIVYSPEYVDEDDYNVF